MGGATIPPAFSCNEREGERERTLMGVATPLPLLCNVACPRHHPITMTHHYVRGTTIQCLPLGCKQRATANLYTELTCGLQ